LVAKENVAMFRSFAFALAAAVLAACDEPGPFVHSGPPPIRRYPLAPYGYGYYQPPEENEWDENDRQNLPPDDRQYEGSEPDSTSRTPDDSSGGQDSPNYTENRPDSNYAAPTPSSLPTAKSLGNGRVESPYAPGKQVDVQGFPPGATVRDPYTGQLFIVPIPKTDQP
jgi:hypothetical protein